MEATVDKVGAKHILGSSEFATVSARFLNRLLWVVFLGMFLYIVNHPLDINHDSAYFLDCGRQMLAGKLQYVDFIDPNPPLITYLHFIPALIASLLPLHIILVFSLLVLSLIIWSTLTIRRIVFVSNIEFNRESLGIILLLWCMFSFCLGFHYGQREHLYVLLYFPFFMMRWVRWEGGEIHLPTAVIVSVAAIIGACMKPYYLFVCLAPELYWAISKRNARNLLNLEMIIVICLGFTYAAHFLLLPDKMLEEFFNRWVPLEVQKYHVYNVPFYHLIMSFKFPFLFIMALLPFLFPSIQKGDFGNLTRPLAIFTLASLLVYLVQLKGFPYHTIPALYGGMLIFAIIANQITQSLFLNEKQIALRSVLGLIIQLIAIAILAYSDRLNYVPRYLPVMKGLVITLFVVMTHVQIKQYFYRRRKKEDLRFTSGMVSQVVVLMAISILLLKWNYRRNSLTKENPLAKIISSYTREGDPILFINTSLIPPYPLLLQMNRQPASRHLYAFPLAMVYDGVKRSAGGEFPYRIDGEQSQEEKRVLREYAEDIATNRPPLIFVHNEKFCSGCPEGFNMMEYLTKIGFIEKAMAEYKLLSTLPKFDVFVLKGKKSYDKT